VKEASAVTARRRFELMMTAIRIIGLGIWVAILSLAISALFCRHGTEEDVTVIYLAIMDLILISIAVRTVLKRI
jgi:hypothetical protein